MDRGTIVRIVTLLLPTVICWKAPKKDPLLATLVLAIYTDKLSLVIVVIVLVVGLEKSRTIVDAM